MHIPSLPDTTLAAIQKKLMEELIPITSTFDPERFYTATHIINDFFPGKTYPSMCKVLKDNKVPYLKFTDSPRARRWYSGADLNKAIKFNSVN